MITYKRLLRGLIWRGKKEKKEKEEKEKEEEGKRK